MLIIYAHPNHEGHCGYILKKVIQKLTEQKINYEVLDLYQMNFDPVLKLNEHYTSGGDQTSPENKIIQEKIKNENKFIIIYPNWWNSTPAILKGFFDRILIRGFAFKYTSKIPKPLLKGRVAVLMPTGGPMIFEKLIAGNRSLKVITKDILKFCGFKAKGYMIGSANRLSEAQKNKINYKVNQVWKFLFK